MGWRRVQLDIEAKLYTEKKGFFSPAKMVGDVEYEEYSNGEKEFSASIKGLKTDAHAANAVITVNGDVVCEVRIRDGKGRLEIKSGEGRDVPVLARGDIVTATIDARTVCTGTARLD